MNISDRVNQLKKAKRIVELNDDLFNIDKLLDSFSDTYYTPQCIIGVSNISINIGMPEDEMKSILLKMKEDILKQLEEMI